MAAWVGSFDVNCLEFLVRSWTGRSRLKRVERWPLRGSALCSSEIS